MKSFRKSTRGLSPIFATLILIAIAVIAGIVVYMFTSGTIASMTGGGTAGQEKAAIQGVRNQIRETAPVALVQNTGGVAITINGYLIKDGSGNIVMQDATGRKLFSNLKKGVRYYLACKVAVVSIFLLAYRTRNSDAIRPYPTHNFGAFHGPCRLSHVRGGTRRRRRNE